MTLAEDLVAWGASQPSWKKAALARFCRNEVYTDEEVSELVEQLIAGTVTTASNIEVDDIPGASSSGEQVVLNSVYDISGINALLPGQILKFSEVGLTVIYGNNASGKSGYARLLREAVTARVKGDVLGDVFSSNDVGRLAKVEFTVGDCVRVWELGEDQAQELTSVRFYDKDCGEDYISKASEITYRPFALTLLDRLQVLCRRLQSDLDRRLEISEQSFPDLPTLEVGTTSAVFIDGLSKNTTVQEIKDAVQLASDHTEVLAAKIQEEARLRATDPNKEKSRLKELSNSWSSVKDHVDKLYEGTSKDAIAAIYSVKSSAENLRRAAQIASSAQFTEEPLDGVGSETWRALWNAAREFSESKAYHDHEFPVVEDGAVCVLCQQPLSSDAADRLSRFERFVSDTTSRDAETAENELAQLRSRLVLLQTVPSSVTEALTKLQASNEDAEPISGWIADATRVAEKTIQWIDGVETGLPNGTSTTPSSAIEIKRVKLAADSEAIDAESFDTLLGSLRSEISELRARSELATVEKNLEQAVSNLKERAKIETAKRQTITTGITQKATDLTTTYVTALARNQFTRETERLDLQRITLNPVRGRNTSTLEHQPELLGANVRVRVSDVFSEGEQTALGLAGFLTEVHLDESKSAVVFDDPVSSLDAGRRSKVAKRLMDLAAERQVIVFTHEITFVNELLRQAEDYSQVVTPRSIQRSGDRPGKVSDKFPWQAQDIPQRMHELEVDLARMKNERAGMDEDEYTKQVRSWAGNLSETWERALNLEIVNQVVDRGTNQVKPLKLKILPKFDQIDHDVFQNGYTKVSSWAPRHDNAPEENFQAPGLDELGSELERLRTWHRRVKAYKN